MLAFYKDLSTALKEDMPELKWVELDKGQLDNPGKFHALICPACLIDFPDVDWEDLSQGRQIGTGLVTFKLVTTIQTDTFVGNPLTDENLVELVLAEKLHAFTRRYGGIKSRLKTRTYTQGSWYVFQQEYELQLKYVPQLISVPVQVQFNHRLVSSK